MASTINASTGPIPGIISTGDNSGVLQLQADGATKLSVGSSGVSFNSPVDFGGSSGTAGQVLTSAGAGSSPTWQTISAGMVFPFYKSTGSYDAISLISNSYLPFYNNLGVSKNIALVSS